jgi:RpiB/LacA/LacB family sugar-phosphate isomerase
VDNTVIIGADHGGFDLKEKVKAYLSEKGYRVTDVGTHSTDSVDYPDYAYAVAQKVSCGEFARGIVICTSGIGVSIVANKATNVRAALCTSVEQARLSRQHNDANVLALSARFTPADSIENICDAWFNTDFEGGRHERRVRKIAECDSDK